MKSILLGLYIIVTALSVPCGVAYASWLDCDSEDGQRAIAACTREIARASKLKEPARTGGLVSSLLSRAKTYQAMKIYDKALADLARLVKLRPFASAYVQRSDIYTAMGDTASAIRELTQAIAADPTDGFHFRLRAQAWEKLGEGEKAASDLEQSEKLDVIERKLVAEGKPLSSIEAIPAEKPVAAVPGDNPAPAIPVQKPAARKLVEEPAPGISVVQKPEPGLPASSGKRVALVIGNAQYKTIPSLANPRRDAESVAQAFRKIGFSEVIQKNDLTREQMMQALQAFGHATAGADWAVIYYAGHSIEIKGSNYVIPIDARLVSDRDVFLETVSLDQIVSTAERARAIRVVILDACRDNPFEARMERTMTERSRSSKSRGLAKMEPTDNTLIVFAAKHGETASDGNGLNSPFTTAFLKNMQVPGVELRRVFDRVRDDVLEATDKRQQPFSYGSVSGRADFFFVQK